jgi:hypothetical protein
MSANSQFLSAEQYRTVTDARDLVIRFEIMPEMVDDASIGKTLSELHELSSAHAAKLEVRDMLIDWIAFEKVKDRDRAMQLVDELSRRLL